MARTVAGETEGSMERDGLERVNLRPATAGDLDAVNRLLRSADLTTGGVAEALAGFVVAEEGDRLVGVAGLELHGGDGVLRSVAVAPAFRGRGLGAMLTERVMAAARAAGLGRLYLLTMTAEGYFPRHGFLRIERSEAPPAVRESIEFREACPESAIAMALDLE